MRFSRAFATIFAITLMASPAFADEASARNSNPNADRLSLQIETMLGQEFAALRSASSNRLRALAASAPKRVKRGWFFGRRSNRLNDTFIYSSADLAGMPRARGGTQWKCLSQALYFEARGESIKGQFAVAEVIMNRTDSSAFPNSICRVVRQGVGQGINRCQFSYNCDGKPETITDQRAYREVGKVARLAMNGEPRTLTRGATFYHSTSVRPRWARRFTETAQIGVHKFYRDNRQARN